MTKLPPPLRSKLFVPGARPELFAKALAGEADALSLDLEDSVPETGKGQARLHVSEFVQSAATNRSGKAIIVRVNALDSDHFKSDIAAIVVPGVALINLPKCESAEDVHIAIAAIERAETIFGVLEPIGLLATIETPKGLRAAAQIGAAHPRVVGLQLGLGDLFEPLGIDRRDAANVHAALFALRMAAGESGVFCCDTAFGDVADAKGFRVEAQMAQRLGFVGKSCIHPQQVPMANAVFSVSAAEIATAQRIVDAASEAGTQGRAAFLFEGRMIDPPFVLRAKSILNAARCDDAP